MQAQYTTPAVWGTETHTRIDREISTAGVARAWRELTPEAFRVVWTGYVVIPETGTYTFATTSDDGSTLTIDGFQVVDNGGNHVPLTKSGRDSPASRSARVHARILPERRRLRDRLAVGA